MSAEAVTILVITGVLLIGIVADMVASAHRRRGGSAGTPRGIISGPPPYPRARRPPPEPSPEVDWS